MFLKANLEGLGVVIKTIYNFVDYNLRVEISSKRRGFQKKRRKFVVMQVSSGRLLRQPRVPRFPRKSNQSALGLGLMWRDSSTARRLFAEIGRPDVPNSRSFAISM